MDTSVINIVVSGPVQVGKSAVFATIREVLERAGYCVAVPDRAERNNPSSPIDKAASHEKPRPDNTVIVLSERVVR